MDVVQRNGGTFGLASAVCLLALLLLFMSSGLDPQTAADPAKALAITAQKPTTWALIGILGALAAGFAGVFSIGIYRRFRERTPTRAAASLLFAIIGLSSHGIGSLLQWQGGMVLVDYAAKDQAAATSAWLALTATMAGFNAMGNAFTGSALLVSGWVILETGAMSRLVGWIALIAGILSLAGLFAGSSAGIFLGAIIFAILWLAQAGRELRQPART